MKSFVFLILFLLAVFAQEQFGQPQGQFGQPQGQFGQPQGQPQEAADEKNPDSGFVLGSVGDTTCPGIPIVDETACEAYFHSKIKDTVPVTLYTMERKMMARTYPSGCIQGGNDELGYFVVWNTHLEGRGNENAQPVCTHTSAPVTSAPVTNAPVTSAPTVAAKNLGYDCWDMCDRKGGACANGYCGSGLCCQYGITENDCDGMHGDQNQRDAHVCVRSDTQRCLPPPGCTCEERIHPILGHFAAQCHTTKTDKGGKVDRFFCYVTGNCAGKRQSEFPELGEYAYCTSIYCTDFGTCGGTGGGAACSFPFIYKGITYNTCTSEDHSEAWCYTTESEEWGISSNLEIAFAKEWGNCLCDEDQLQWESKEYDTTA